MPDERFLAMRFGNVLKIGSFSVLLFLVLSTTQSVWAQQRIGYVDTKAILEQMPAYRSIQQKLDRKVQTWEKEIAAKQEALDKMRRTFQARKLLFTEEERARRKQEIQATERALRQLRQKYFGPEGKLYAVQQRLLRPLQERILRAVETVAQTKGYGYVLDKSGEVVLLYAPEQHNLTDDVLRELGIDLEGNESEANEVAENVSTPGG